MNVSKRPKYTKEFKERAVRLSMADGVNVHDLADELGIGRSSLTRWRDQAGVSASRGTDSPRAIKDENEELRRQLKQAEKEKKALAMEVEILKKAAAFFAKHSL